MNGKVERDEIRAPAGWTLLDALDQHVASCPCCMLCVAGRTILDGLLIKERGQLGRFVWGAGKGNGNGKHS